MHGDILGELLKIVTFGNEANVIVEPQLFKDPAALRRALGVVRNERRQALLNVSVATW